MPPKKRKSALVTGATGDIGSAIAAKLVEQGYFVVATGRNAQKGKELVRDLGAQNCLFRAADLGKPDSVSKIISDKIFDTHPLHVVVACAGTLKMQPTARLSTKDWQDTLDTNLTGVFTTLQAGLKKMLKSKTGHLIAIGSRWGESGAKNAAAYAASKSALRALVRSLQLELKDTGIRPTLISPGSVAGRMATSVDRKSASKYISPQDVADLISYVISTPDTVIFDEIKIKAYRHDLTS